MRVAVVRKPIKNLHLGVYPPSGKVRVAAPLALSTNAVRVAIVQKLGWIKRQQKAFDEQARQSQRALVDGESHYFLGRRYRLAIVITDGARQVKIRNRNRMELHVRHDDAAECRAEVLDQWYRERLREMVPALIEKWQPTLRVKVAAWRIKKMKTKWGSCNAHARRIWLNLELIKKPVECVEYLVVHEMAHLLVRRHGDQFQALMDRHFPRWRMVRKILNAAPLAHVTWQY
jgi:predicted metal-dependent hydrolase